MLSVKGLYDGEKIKFLEKVGIDKPRKVIITFLDEDIETSSEIYKLAEEGGAFDFLKEPEEDIYTDDKLKVKYKK
jgi:hypothetical protein